MRFKDLPEEIKQLVIRRSVRSTILDGTDIGNLFVFQNTTEGGEFWYAINRGDLQVFYDEYYCGIKKDDPRISEFSVDGSTFVRDPMYNYLVLKDGTRISVRGFKQKFKSEDTKLNEVLINELRLGNIALMFNAGDQDLLKRVMREAFPAYKGIVVPTEPSYYRKGNIEGAWHRLSSRPSDIGVFELSAFELTEYEHSDANIPKEVILKPKIKPNVYKVQKITPVISRGKRPEGCIVSGKKCKVRITMRHLRNRTILGK